MYNPSKMWILVIVHFMDGSERWGTVKKGKYGKIQSGQERTYTGWFIDNDDHAVARGWLGEFKPYEF